MKSQEKAVIDRPQDRLRVLDLSAVAGRDEQIKAIQAWGRVGVRAELVSGISLN